jgi:hypothetical protein
MSKAFTRESDAADDDSDDGATGSVAPALPAGARNYITRGGLQRLRDELQYLLHTERPAVTAVVSWAAGNGDRSENADYQYGKRRLREIDRASAFWASASTWRRSSIRSNRAAIAPIRFFSGPRSATKDGPVSCTRSPSSV